MVNIRQSKEYSLFMETLGWKVESAFVKTTAGKQKIIYVFIRKFPLIGSFIKTLRIIPPIPFQAIEKIAKKSRAFKVQIEPDTDSNWTNKSNLSNLTNGYQLAKASLAPTKTIFIDLKSNEEEIFNSFSPEKRRAIRRAIKNKVVVKKSNNINEFIDLKNKQLWPFGFLLSNEIKKLWEVFKPAKKTVLLLAYKNNINLSLPGENKMNDEAISAKKEIATHRPPSGPARNDTEVLAGVLLLFHDKISYYWLASSTTEGKTLFAPSLLVWEALKLSKKKSCTTFDFEGVKDSRFPETKSWAGFSKFKNGFGGKEISFASPIQKLFWPIR
ncbi:MAG: peptidoglycan bridge formation glycyltransferase FemA/FemB family protein [Patescibacteria group bacterium]|nr:peptidoglycan bridge formation glycyltransferase FemA/FemB family protein [Patescibacteria group bacterium]